jgi:hypothetical protein
MSEEWVPLKPAHERHFKTLKVDAFGNVNTDEGYDRAVEPVPKILEQLADQLAEHPEASGTLEITVKNPLSISCQWVVCQFHERFPNVTLVITEQLTGRKFIIQGNKK